jgi:hypothetical protein
LSPEGRLIAESVVTAGDWAEAVRRVRAYYPEDILPWPSETLEGKCAFMARQVCENIANEARRVAAERIDGGDSA